MMFDYYPSIGIVITLLTIAYFILPEKYTGKKYEYVKFFLCSLSSLWIVCMLYKLLLTIVPYKSDLYPTIGQLCTFLFIPWIAVTHLIYPFRRTERNKTFTFLTLGSMVISFVTGIVLYGLVQMSNM